MPDFLVNNAQFLGGCSEFFLVMVYYNRTPNLKCVAALLTTTVILLCCLFRSFKIYYGLK